MVGVSGVGFVWVGVMEDAVDDALGSEGEAVGVALGFDSSDAEGCGDVGAEDCSLSVFISSFNAAVLRGG